MKGRGLTEGLGLAELLRSKPSGRGQRTEKVVTERIEESVATWPDDSRAAHLVHWIQTRELQHKVADDFTQQEYSELVAIAMDASRQNLGQASTDSGLRVAATGLRTAMSQVLGPTAPTVAERGSFHPLYPDVGRLMSSGLVADSRHFVRRKYKRSTDSNVQTVRRHWFSYCLLEARTSPIRPLSGTNLDATTLEEDLWVNFVSYLARRGIQGDTITGYLSTLKRWHKTVTGWDPISSAAVQAASLSAALAGVRADFPSKQKQRFAHPTRLFKEWWAPLLTPLDKLGGTSVLDQDPTDISRLTVEHRRAMASAMKQSIEMSGMSVDDFKGLVLSTVMTAGLLRVSEAIPEPGEYQEQEPIMFDDLVFHWNRDGSQLRYAELWVLPLKKGRQARKVPIKMKFSKGNVRAAHLLWLYSLLWVIPESERSSTPLFTDYTFEPDSDGRRTGAIPKRSRNGSCKVISQAWLRNWYHAKMRAAGVVHYLCYNTHSFRIGGATALLGAKVSIERIKAMGRWASDCVEIYTQQTLDGALDLSEALDRADASPIEDCDDHYFDRIAGVSENAADDWAAEMALEADELTENLE